MYTFSIGWCPSYGTASCDYDYGDQFCKDHYGGQLATPTTQAEYDFIVAIVGGPATHPDLYPCPSCNSGQTNIGGQSGCGCACAPMTAGAATCEGDAMAAYHNKYLLGFVADGAGNWDVVDDTRFREDETAFVRAHSSDGALGTVQTRMVYFAGANHVSTALVSPQYTTCLSAVQSGAWLIHHCAGNLVSPVACGRVTLFSDRIACDCDHRGRRMPMASPLEAPAASAIRRSMWTHQRALGASRVRPSTPFIHPSIQHPVLPPLLVVAGSSDGLRVCATGFICGFFAAPGQIVIGEDMEWDEARSFCQEKTGGDLLSLHSQADYDKLAALTGKYNLSLRGNVSLRSNLSLRSTQAICRCLRSLEVS